MALLSAVMLAACSSTNIRDLNLRPDKHYEQKLTVTGRVMRMQAVGGDTLLEIADPRDSRVLVRASHPVDATVGDWVKVTGCSFPRRAWATPCSTTSSSPRTSRTPAVPGSPI